MFYICIYSQEELPTIRLKRQCQAIPVSLYYQKDFFASMKFQTEITVEFCLITKGCVTVLPLLRMARMEMNLKSSETLYCTTCSVKNQGHPTSKNKKNALNAVYCFLVSFYGLLKGYLCELTLFYLFGCGS